MSINRKSGTNVSDASTHLLLTTNNSSLASLNNRIFQKTEIAAGVNSKYSAATIVGGSENLSTGTPQIISRGNGSGLNITFPTATEKFSIASTNVNDTAAGTGAQSVFILGLDTNKETIFEILALNGQTPVLTVNDYSRINVFFVYQTGSGGQNAGTIYVSSEAQTWTAGGVPTTLLYKNIEIGAGYSQTGTYTTPSNVTNTIIGNVSVSTNVTGTKEVELYVESRRNGLNSWLRTAVIPITTGTSVFNIDASGVYQPGTDIRLRAIATSANTKIEVYYLLTNYTSTA